MIIQKIKTILTVAALAFAGQLSAAETAATSPNVIVIFTDDMGYADAGCYGAQDINTPNLDRMAAEGVRFTDFYSANAVCSPSRAAMLTGRYPTRCNVPNVLFPRDSHGFPTSEVTIAEILKDAGYATACIGKWHLGHKPEFLPTRQGFDYYLGIPYSNDMWIDKTAPLASDLKLNGGATVEKIRSGGGEDPIWSLFEERRWLKISP
jgi:arylsulfatase A-like enzyme